MLEAVTGSMCGECYGRRSKLISLERSMNFTYCPTCSSDYNRGGWCYFDKMDDRIDERIMEKLEVDQNFNTNNIELAHRIFDKHRREVKVKVTGSVGRAQLNEAESTTVFIKSEQCLRCSRKAGGYFESIVQIRHDKDARSLRRLTEIIQFIQDEIQRQGVKDRSSFISEIEEVRGGVDLYLSKISDARRIASALSIDMGVPIKESSSVVSKRDGRDIRRVTFALRIPLFEKEDYIHHDNRVWKVVSATSKNVHLMELRTGSHDRFYRKDVEGCEVLGSKDSIMRAVVISRDKNGRELKLMHPVSYATVDVVIPSQIEIDDKAGEVSVVVYGAEIFLV